MLFNYRITSNKRPGRLLKFSDFRRGVYLRGAFIEKIWEETQKRKAEIYSIEGLVFFSLINN